MILGYLKMNINTDIKGRRAQTAIEYLLLLMVVVVIVLVGFKLSLPRVREASNLYYNRAAPAILGEPPRCGDGVCRPPPFETCEKCPTDCGTC
ncbi:MAG: class III signal peptide-containing protein [Candidatus Omnitrophica bacterium]|nr:class III signal peptide-containing protein [Candidatus Omnitrophota bacterium]